MTEADFLPGYSDEVALAAHCWFDGPCATRGGDDRLEAARAMGPGAVA